MISNWNGVTVKDFDATQKGLAYIIVKEIMISFGQVEIDWKRTVSIKLNILYARIETFIFVYLGGSFLLEDYLFKLTSLSDIVCRSK